MSFETRLAFGRHSCCQQMSTSTCGGPSPFCIGMWTRKASAGQDMVPGCSLCWAIQLWLFLPAEGYYFALLCEREVCVHLTGSTCVSPCYFQHCSIFMSEKKEKKTFLKLLPHEQGCRKNLCVSERICSVLGTHLQWWPSTLEQGAQLQIQKLNSKTHLENMTGVTFVYSSLWRTGCLSSIAYAFSLLKYFGIINFHRSVYYFWVLQKLSIHRLYFGGFKDFFGFCVVLLLLLLIFVLVFGSFWF